MQGGLYIFLGWRIEKIKTLVNHGISWTEMQNSLILSTIVDCHQSSGSELPNQFHFIRPQVAFI